MTTASEMIAVARRFRGVRFAHQGRTMQGLDCLGLLLVTAEAAGITVNGLRVMALDMPAYGVRPDHVMLQQKLGEVLMRVEKPEVGDVLLLRIDGAPQHLALVSDYPAAGEWGMIHAYAVARKVVEHRYDAHWQGVTQGIYRLPQLVS